MTVLATVDFLLSTCCLNLLADNSYFHALSSAIDPVKSVPNFRLDDVIYIGDQQTDAEASINAFVKPVLITNKNKINKISNKLKPIFYSKKLSKLVQKINIFYANKQ